jgi:hypothetical protein
MSVPVMIFAAVAVAVIMGQGARDRADAQPERTAGPVLGLQSAAARLNSLQAEPIRISHNSRCDLCLIVLEKLVTLGKDGQPDSLTAGPIERDSRGRYMTMAVGRSGIVVYDSAGNFANFLKGQWDGTAAGARLIGFGVGPRDSLYLFTGDGVFSVYSPDHTYVRTARLPRSDAAARAVMNDGRILFAPVRDSVFSDAMLLQLSDGDGRSLAAFGSSRLSVGGPSRSGVPIARPGRPAIPPSRIVPFRLAQDERSVWLWSADEQPELRFDPWGIDDPFHATVLITDLPPADLPVRSTLLGVDSSGSLWIQRLLTSEMMPRDLESVLEIVDVARRRIFGTVRLDRNMNIHLIQGTHLLAMSPGTGASTTRREIMRVLLSER